MHRLWTENSEGKRLVERFEHMKVILLKFISKKSRESVRTVLILFRIEKNGGLFKWFKAIFNSPQNLYDFIILTLSYGNLYWRRLLWKHGIFYKLKAIPRYMRTIHESHNVCSKKCNTMNKIIPRTFERKSQKKRITIKSHNVCLCLVHEGRNNNSFSDEYETRIVSLYLIISWVGETTWSVYTQFSDWPHMPVHGSVNTRSTSLAIMIIIRRVFHDAVEHNKGNILSVQAVHPFVRKAVQEASYTTLVRSVSRGG